MRRRGEDAPVPEDIARTLGLRGAEYHEADGVSGRIEGRVPLRDLIERGVEPPEELTPEILLKGRVHSIYGPASSGKSWMMLWLVRRCVEHGERVLLFDDENGPRIVAERLSELDTPTDRIDELLYYFPDPNLAMDAKISEAYELLLDELDPALIVFDSLIGFLANAGFEENSNDGVANWCHQYTRPARQRGIAVVLLDHVPHEGGRARGASRKKDAMDVMWALSNPVPFDRENVGEVRLLRVKDREGVLPHDVTFSVGGGEQGFLFARSSGTVEETDEDGMTDSARRLLDYLEGRAGEGAAWREIVSQIGSKATVSRALSELGSRNLFRKGHNRYYRHPPAEPETPVDEPNSQRFHRVPRGSTEPTEPGPPREVPPGSTPLRGGTVEPRAEPAPKTPENGTSEEALARFLSAPPSWWLRQAEIVLREGSPSRLVAPLVSSTAAEVLGDPRRRTEASTAVEAKLREMGAT